MLAFVGRRLLHALLVLLLLSVATRALLNAMPGDPIDSLKRSSPHPLSQADIDRLKEHYGLSDPFAKQYFKWLGQLASGDLGYSRSHQTPVRELLWPALERSLVLGGLTLLLALPCSVLLGVRSAVSPGSLDDFSIRSFCSLGISIPTFWLCLLLIQWLSLRWGWFPPDAQVLPGEGDWWEQVRALVLPVLALAIPVTADWARYVRAGMLDVRHAEYLLAARARGASQARVLWRHMLPSALTPFFTVLGLSLPYVVGGELVVETVFGWPGLGLLEYSAIRDQDYNVAMSALLLIAAITLLGSLLADFLNALVDPRIRSALLHGERKGGPP